jgi:uncharacterized protein (TIGR02246 family)
MPLSADDQLAIMKLLADYNHAIDSGDADAWADTFSSDAVFNSGFEEVTGRDSLVAFAAATHEMLPGGRHHLANISIDGSGDDATVRCYLQMWNTQGGAGSTSLVISGNYDDSLHKEDGRWRFTSRSMTPDT